MSETRDCNISPEPTDASIDGDIAIIGMSCIFPQAPDVLTYWHNIVNKVDAITDPPEDWEAELFYDPDTEGNDRTYCKRGGYLGELARFDPLKYGVMPNSVDGGEPDQFLALRVAHEALADAGYLHELADPTRVEVIIGRGTYINRGFTTVVQHGIVVNQVLKILKQLHPEHTEAELQAIKAELKASLPPFNAEMSPALVPNVMSGRIANRLDLMGANYTVDAACASSHIAVERGMQDLLGRKCDMALIGGVHCSTPAPILMIFSQLNALSRSGQLRPFDKDADGTMLGEGLGFIVIKRRADALRDGDRIYAIIKGFGTASDGRALGLLAPRVEGEELALRRAYEATGISPRTIELIEAHGTGTLVGDLAEIQALTKVFGPREGEAQTCAVGTVKSMISHLIPASGIAGLIKTTLALYHKVLPPTLNYEEPNPKLELEKTPFYLNTETRPWIHGSHTPRRAGVNAFGFGGINAHVILEEYRDEHENESPTFQHQWETEVCILQANSRQELISLGQQLGDYLDSEPLITLKDFAYTLNSQLVQSSSHRLALVASSLKDASQKISHALKRLADPQCVRVKDQNGIYFFEHQLSRDGRLAFLFPGEGSQYVNMLSDLCMHFPEVRGWFDLIDRAFLSHQRKYLPSQIIFPPPTGTGHTQETLDRRLWQMDCGPEAIFTANQAMLTLLHRLHLQPDAVLGHSTGEYSALVASGANPIEDDEQLIQDILSLNSFYEQLAREGRIPEGILLTVGGADRDFVMSLVQHHKGLHLAMDNCPHQMVLCGTNGTMDQVTAELREKGAICTALPFNRAYHTPLFEPFCHRLGEFFQKLKIVEPKTEMYSCITAAPYPRDPAEIRRLAVEQWARPVRFRETILAMYEAGVRIFLEVGPRNNLTAFVDDTLRGKPYLALASNVPHRTGLTQLNHTVGMLAAHGVPLRLDHLYARRAPQRLSFSKEDEKRENTKESARSIKLKMGLQPLRLQRNGTNGSAGVVSARVVPASSNPVHPNADASANHPATLSNEATVNQRMPANGNGAAKPAPLAAQSLHSFEHNSQNSARANVMQGYLQTMESFLNMQGEVMRAFMRQARERGQPQPADRAHVSQQSPALPLIGTVTSLIPGQELIALRRIDVKEDTFLLDHTLGRRVSLVDEELTGLPVVPLTMSMEMMAEAASVLLPGKRLIGMREVRAYRWIALDHESLTLQLIARRQPSASGAHEEVLVQIKEMDADSLKETHAQAPNIIEGTMLFGEEFPEPPAVGEFSLRAERPSKWKPAQLYSELMFHGPMFQGVASVERSGEDGTEGTLRGIGLDQFFKSEPEPQFLSDVVPLDATGQLVGYWTAEHLSQGFHVFPFRVEELRIYGPNLRPLELATCRARIALVDRDQVRSDIDVIGPDGRVQTSIKGWWDKRFDLPDRFFRIRLSPREFLLAQSWSNPIAGCETPENLSCYLLDDLSQDFLGAHGKIWQRTLAHLVLSRREREVWRNLKGPEKRRNEWLLGRAAAKDAVRSFIKRRHGIELCPADVEIAQDEHGQPFASGNWTKNIEGSPALSISHTDGVAVALAGEDGRGTGIGIDIERLTGKREDLEAFAFTTAERSLLASFEEGVEEASREEWAMRLWCAKEAVSKALGRGMINGPLGLSVRQLDARTGIVKVALSGAQRLEGEGLSGVSMTAYTLRDDNLVVAVALVKRD
ncbi:MAG TPA: beta-ketoacyl synthase N-terminal-like domain-containing protein [Pyrinomonadaceae bacterium]|jgi:acyl transferase domain-containing protein|nr:beta-ketoacyl synthase N-terminal-like domain-containing protein [Pyrinomonadaceae bacterium]